MTAAAALAVSAVAVRADEPAATDHSQEIRDLRARLDQLEARQKEAEKKRQVAEQKLEEKITSDKLAVEAVQRDQFIAAEGFTAGYSDGRFVIGDSQGNFTFKPWLHFQARGIVNERNAFQGSKKLGINDEFNSGFEIRRVRFGVDGNMFSPDFTYFFNWATSRTSSNTTVSGATASTTGGSVTASNSLGGVPILEEAWVKYHFPTSPWSVRVGQIKDPLLHDQIVSSRYQHSAERSVTADLFANGDGFTEAATVIYDEGADGNLRVEGGVNHGLRSANTNFYDYPNNGSYNQFNYGLTGRVEYRVFGKWKDYSAMGSNGDKEQLLVFGLGADYSERGHDGQLVTAFDAVYNLPTGRDTSANFYGAFVDRYTTHNFGYYTQSPTGASINTPTGTMAPAILGHNSNEYSILFEAGYEVDKHIEPFARYEVLHVVGTPKGSRTYCDVVTAGCNYFFHGHRLKLTGEIIWLPQGLPFDDTPNDVLASPAGHTEIVYEIQLQLML